MPCFTNLEYDDYLRLCRERGPRRTIDDLAAGEASRREVEASIEGRMIETAERIVAALEDIVAALEDRRSGPSEADTDFLEVAGLDMLAHGFVRRSPPPNDTDPDRGRRGLSAGTT